MKKIMPRPQKDRQASFSKKQKRKYLPETYLHAAKDKRNRYSQPSALAPSTAASLPLRADTRSFALFL